MFISRVKLADKPFIASIRTSLLPEQREMRIAAAHKLIWTMFGDKESRTADFIWRDNGDGSFVVVSARSPEPNDLLDIQTRPFEPHFETGMLLRFQLCANATISTKPFRGAPKGHREDILTRALRDLSSRRPRATPEEKTGAKADAALNWLERQGEANGFNVVADYFSVTDESFLMVPREKGTLQFGAIEMSGILEVTEPGALQKMLGTGLGRGKRFGCGLMLVARAAG